MNMKDDNRKEQPQLLGTPGGTLLAAQALHNADRLGREAAEKKEERISLFWRVFGGTLLSIAAMVVVTAYQQLAGGINEVRSSMDQRAKKDEFYDHRTKVWDRLRQMEIAEEKVDQALQERCIRLEQQAKDAEQNRQEMVRELQWLREATVAALKERSALLESQVKAGKEGQEDLARELKQLRERLGAIETRRTSDGAVQSAAHESK